MDGDLGERGVLGAMSDWGLGDEEGLVKFLERVFGVNIFLDVGQDVLRKLECRCGRF